MGPKTAADLAPAPKVDKKAKAGGGTEKKPKVGDVKGKCTNVIISILVILWGLHDKTGVYWTIYLHKEMPSLEGMLNETIYLKYRKIMPK